jgi:hypothetical protein
MLRLNQFKFNLFELNMAIKNISNGRGMSLCNGNILPLKNMVVWPQQSLTLGNKIDDNNKF